MSTNWMADIFHMHQKYGVHEAIANLDDEKLQKFLEFRIAFLDEELTELKNADTADEVVDALIDLCVVAIGTLDLFKVNSLGAWNGVHEANMSKMVGVKDSRPNPLGLPDLIKPDGWEAPEHFRNVGLLNRLMPAGGPVTEPAPATEVSVEEVIKPKAAPKKKRASRKKTVKKATTAPKEETPETTGE